MSESGARPGFGIKFALGDGQSTEGFANLLGEILNVNGVGVTHRTAEVTNMSSPGGWAEHIGLGVKEGKQFTIGLNAVLDDANQVLLRQRAESGAKHNYRITFTDVGLATLTFGAIITDVDLNHDRDSQAQATITILPSGAHTWAA